VHALDVAARQHDLPADVEAIVFGGIGALVQHDDLRLAIKGKAAGHQVEGALVIVGQLARLGGGLNQVERRLAGIPLLEAARGPERSGLVGGKAQHARLQPRLDQLSTDPLRGLAISRTRLDAMVARDVRHGLRGSRTRDLLSERLPE
jgi:hypothetical protein